MASATPPSIPVDFAFTDARGRPQTLRIDLPVPPGTQLHAQLSGGALGGARAYTAASVPVLNACVIREDDVVSRAQIDRSTWMRDVVADVPAVRDVQERLSPWKRTLSFVTNYDVGNQLVKEQMTRALVDELVLQHISYMGYHVHRDLDESRLEHLLHEAVKVHNHLVDATLRPSSESVDAEARLIDSLLELGLESPDEFDTDQDTPMWQDERGDSMILDASAGSDPLVALRAASLNRLVEIVTGTSGDAAAHMRFMKTFLMTYRSFTSPDKLLQKLMERFRVPDVQEYQTQRVPIQLRVVNVIRYWIENYWFDWSAKLQQQLRAFVSQSSMSAGLSAKLLTALEKQSRPNVNEREMSLRSRLGQAPLPKVPKNIFSPTLMLFDVDEEEIARQLCLIDFRVYSQIKPNELLNLAWDNAKFRHPLRKRVLDVEMWVAWVIASQQTSKSRARMITHFITLATHLCAMGNYNTVLAVLAGLSRTKLLTSSWDEVQRKDVQHLQTALEPLANPSDRYHEYRAALEQHPPPKIPFLGLALRDLELVEKRNSNTTNGLINFEKRQLVYASISSLLQYQNDVYLFVEVVQVSSFLKDLPKIDGKRLSALLATEKR